MHGIDTRQIIELIINYSASKIKLLAVLIAEIFCDRHIHKLYEGGGFV